MSFIIDLIIYAHDGRGLGHVSRSVAIGLAVRRLFPKMSVLLITGCSAVAELIGDGDLDWIKLPSYKTKILAGKSSGAEGPSQIDDKTLGELRAQNIRHIFKTYRPKVFLADHTPQGKHKELIACHSVSHETVRVLGIRAVVGDVDKVWSEFSADFFKKGYSKIFWYGDSKITGINEIKRVKSCYGIDPIETGYVSRFSELGQLSIDDGAESKNLAGVVSVPWSGEGTFLFLEKLAEAISQIDHSYGLWKIYMNLREATAYEAIKFFEFLPNVCFSQVGPEFLCDLHGSRSAVIYGGYNSLTDVMASGTPAVVLLRGMKDGEQEEHAALLASKSSAIVDVFSEDNITADCLRESLLKCIQTKPEVSSVNLNGAENAARYLASLAGVTDANS
ncbi:hypothetical protein [Maridesulfovibrio zosterae]|uniref:hypothetical protein n=1 Tax=Maridesulfovibrio zosterae TaxID=82171 RepID=UPI0003FC27BD|nr:hypothetical protein [Maridesulfovibrio zosterae]